MTVIKLVIDYVLEGLQVMVIDDEAKFIQRIGFQHQLRNIIMPMQATAFMCVWQPVDDMAGAEMKLFGESIHGVVSMMREIIS